MNKVILGLTLVIAAAALGLAGYAVWRERILEAPAVYSHFERVVIKNDSDKAVTSLNIALNQNSQPTGITTIAPNCYAVYGTDNYDTNTTLNSLDISVYLAQVSLPLTQSLSDPDIVGVAIFVISGNAQNGYTMTAEFIVKPWTNYNGEISNVVVKQ